MKKYGLKIYGQYLRADSALVKNKSPSLMCFDNPELALTHVRKLWPICFESSMFLIFEIK